MKARIAVLGGDGIGPEVTAEAVRVLQAVGTRYGHEFEFTRGADRRRGDRRLGFGPAARARSTRAAAAPPCCWAPSADRKWSGPAARVRPEQGLLELRRTLGLFANLRPVRTLAIDAGRLAAEAGGHRRRRHHGRARTDGRHLFRPQEPHGARGRGRLHLHDRGGRTRHARGRTAGDGSRKRHIVSVDKANVLETSRLWRAVAERVLQRRISRRSQFEHMLVDAAAMHLMRRPASFDVILTENMFGDILTDEASMIAGSLGLLPSASLGAGNGRPVRTHSWLGPRHRGPRHRESLRHDPECCDAARSFARTRRRGGRRDSGVEDAVSAGVRTADIAAAGKAAVGSREAGSAVVERLLSSP